MSRRRRRVAWGAWLLAACALHGFTASPAAAQRSARNRAPIALVRAASGCWMLDRALATRGGAMPKGGDATFRALVLHANGAVTRPRIPAAREREMWRRSSGWVVRGDSVEVLLSSGLAGWRISLGPVNSAGRSDGFAGMAVYLTDAIARDWTPPTNLVTLSRRGCASADSAAASPPPGWTDAPPVHFDVQVDTPAVRLDRTTLRAGRPGVVLAQFVVGLDGRVEHGSFRIVRSGGAEADSAVARGISRLRYRPARAGSAAVRQLAHLELAVAPPERR